MKGALKQMTVLGKVFKYRVQVLELDDVDKKSLIRKTLPNTEFRLPSGVTVTFPNWDVMGIRERFYREEYLDPEVHYNQPKQVEPSEFGVKASNIRKFIEDNIDVFDPLPPTGAEPLPPEPKFEPIQVAGQEPETAGVTLEFSEAHSA